MTPEPDMSGRPAGSLIGLAGLALIGGAGAGLVGALFCEALKLADSLRDELLPLAHEQAMTGLVAVIAVCAGAPALAAWLVRRFAEDAAGSGISHVEAVLAGRSAPAHFTLLPVKFLGGLLAIGVGLPLGREGPSLQMGAAVSLTIGRLFRRDRADCLALIAGGAGAGLAIPFNAPMSGAVFAIEELLKKFEIRTAITALGSSAAALFVARFFLGYDPNFDVPAPAVPAAAAQPLFVFLGAIAGLLAVAYNRAILGALDAAGRATCLPVELRAAMIGASVGVTAWFAPDLAGHGDALAQRMLDGAEPLESLPFALVSRVALGAAAYAAGTPGGLFAPLVAVGAQFGLIFGILAGRLFPDLDIQPEIFVVAGMAALFAGMVRAPLTGIVLVMETTAHAELLLPMLSAGFAAMIAPTLLGDTPICEALRDRSLARSHARQSSADARRRDRSS